MSSITPTIGRKVWFWASSAFQAETGLTPLDGRQAYDATVVYVDRDGAVNLKVIDHEGNEGLVENCPLCDPSPEGDAHGGLTDFATWMPYQVGQAKK